MNEIYRCLFQIPTTFVGTRLLRFISQDEMILIEVQTCCDDIFPKNFHTMYIGSSLVKKNTMNQSRLVESSGMQKHYTTYEIYTINACHSKLSRYEWHSVQISRTASNSYPSKYMSSQKINLVNICRLSTSRIFIMYPKQLLI